jgi:hypothetical protein
MRRAALIAEFVKERDEPIDDAVRPQVRAAVGADHRPDRLRGCPRLSKSPSLIARDDPSRARKPAERRASAPRRKTGSSSCLPSLHLLKVRSLRQTRGGSVAQLVPLSTQASAILRAALRHQSGDLVFPGLRGTFSGFSKAKLALDKASRVENWRLHDLRRTMATGLQRLGVRHQRHTWAEEKRAALTAWAAYVEAIVETRELRGNVTPLHTRTL